MSSITRRIEGFSSLSEEGVFNGAESPKIVSVTEVSESILNMPEARSQSEIDALEGRLVFLPIPRCLEGVKNPPALDVFPTQPRRLLKDKQKERVDLARKSEELKKAQAETFSLEFGSDFVQISLNAFLAAQETNQLRDLSPMSNVSLNG